MKINLKRTIQFKNLSKDYNLIHYNKNFSSKFHFKSPIVHGINATLIALAKFLKVRKVTINSIKINFLNFILVNEKIFFQMFKNKIEIYNNLNKKIEIYLKTRKSQDKTKEKISYNVKKFFNLSQDLNSNLINELIFISRFIGSIKPGNGSLIQKVQIECNERKNEKRKILIKKITKQIFEISYFHKNLKVKVIANKLVPFIYKNKKTKISKKILQKIKGKKILIFGPSSDLSKRLLLTEIKTYCKIYTHSFRISDKYQFLKKGDFNNLKKLILNINPDYVFYFSSPLILKSSKYSKDLFLNYKLVYVDYFHNVLKIIKNNELKTRVFYPSSYFLKKSQKLKEIRLNHYIKAKEQAEKICKNSSYRKFVNYYRLPRFQSRSNYNLLGFYEGEKISLLDKYLNHFFKKK